MVTKKFLSIALLLALIIPTLQHCAAKGSRPKGGMLDTPVDRSKFPGLETVGAMNPPPVISMTTSKRAQPKQPEAPYAKPDSAAPAQQTAQPAPAPTSRTTSPVEPQQQAARPASAPDQRPTSPVTAPEDTQTARLATPSAEDLPSCNVSDDEALTPPVPCGEPSPNRNYQRAILPQQSGTFVATTLASLGLGGDSKGRRTSAEHLKYLAGNGKLQSACNPKLGEPEKTADENVLSRFPQTLNEVMVALRKIGAQHSDKVQTVLRDNRTEFTETAYPADLALVAAAQIPEARGSLADRDIRTFRNGLAQLRKKQATELATVIEEMQAKIDYLRDLDEATVAQHANPSSLEPISPRTEYVQQAIKDKK